MENKKGQGIFYGVIGVATLIVAIIGATFAYFSASQPGNGASIGGNTNGDVAGNLSLEVSRLTFSAASAASDDLVPAIMDTENDDTTDLQRALTAGCTNDGFTGCHVYKITAEADANVTTANLKLNLSVTATDKDNWKYLVYSGSDTTSAGSTSAATVTSITTSATSLATDAEDVDIFRPAGGLTANTPISWYLVVYLENIDAKQNGGTGANDVDETGSYTGSVSLQAAGGQVKANFGA